MNLIGRSYAAQAFMELLEFAEQELRKAQARRRVRPRSGIGAALRPGPNTPLWLALAGEVESRLTRWGEKAALGRHLGLSRQRINLLIVKKSALPDAERALQLFAWVLARDAGRGELIAGRTPDASPHRRRRAGHPPPPPPDARAGVRC